jgi:aminoglycoside phosphotransferase (APT) family kinase protein
LIEHEQRWLPHLASRLPLPIPSPVRVGQPSHEFPWRWSVVPWFSGETADRVPIADGEAVAVSLGRFLEALHRPAPADAPGNPWRGVDLTQRTPLLERHLSVVDALVDRRAIVALWERLAATPPWCGPPLWIHGDLHPGNLLIENGRLSAVIDFGDLTSGDPATDLSVAWMLLPPRHRPAFRAAARSSSDSIDEDTWRRARAWALALGVSYLANSRDDEPLAALGRTTIGAALAD